jgi:hypothetical protein
MYCAGADYQKDTQIARNIKIKVGVALMDNG